MVLEDVPTEELINKHNQLIKDGEKNDIYSIRMEIWKRTGCMDWESEYRHLNSVSFIDTERKVSVVKI